MGELRVRAGSLRVRLALAFVGVAVAAVAALAVVILLTTSSETGRLSTSDRERTAAEVAGVLADAYRRAGSWAGADVAAAQAVARAADAVLVVRTAGGRTVLPAPRSAPAHRGAGPIVVTRSVVVAGHPVGVVELRFPNRLTAAQSLLRDKLFGAVLLGSAIAVGIALLGAVLVAQTLAVPIRRLATTARRLRAGDLSARVGGDAPGELGQLARAFDAMAQTLDDERAARRRLVGDLAHEVRTPISILRGNLEELVDGLAEPTPERLASLHEEVLRLGTLVDDLDDLARADAPIAALDRRPVELAELARAQLEALRPQLDSKNLTLHAQLSTATVLGDRSRLGQVLANVLGNAVKFTPPNGHITVELGALNGRTSISVTDSGPGIPEDELERVFERFWRGRGSQGTSGRGIGLAVAAEIIRAHGGAISAHNEPAGGARFEVILPTADSTSGQWGLEAFA